MTLYNWYDGKANQIALPLKLAESSSLLPIEFADLPFQPKRIFCVVNETDDVSRGAHGHRIGKQLLICLNGKIDIEMHYQNQQTETVLTPNGVGLLVSENIWFKQTYVKPTSVLLVLASHAYNPASYFFDKSQAL